VDDGFDPLADAHALSVVIKGPCLNSHGFEKRLQLTALEWLHQRFLNFLSMAQF